MSPTSEDRCDTGHLPATTVATSQLARPMLFIWHWPRQRLSWGRVTSNLEQEPCISGWKKRVRDSGRGEAGRLTLHSMASHCPSPGFTNRRTAYLSGFQVSKKIFLIKKIIRRLLSPLLSSNDFEIIGPQFGYQLWRFLTLWPGARNLPGPLCLQVSDEVSADHIRVVVKALEAAGIHSFSLRSQSPL